MPVCVIRISFNVNQDSVNSDNQVCLFYDPPAYTENNTPQSPDCYFHNLSIRPFLRGEGKKEKKKRKA